MIDNGVNQSERFSIYLKDLDFHCPYLITTSLEVSFFLKKEVSETDIQLINVTKKLIDSQKDNFNLFCAIYVLVDGELTHKKTFHNLPVFYRRLASLSHASIIVNVLISKSINTDLLIKWAMNKRGMHFLCNSLVELKDSPRWLPEYIEGDLIGRVYQTAMHQESKLSEEEKHFFTEENENSLINSITMTSYLPSPLEGNIPPPILPKAFEKIINSNLYPENPKNLSLNPIINSSQYWKLEDKDILTIVEKLQESKRHLNTSNQSDILYTLSGFAKLASSTKNTALADELFIVFRIYSNYLDLNKYINELFSYGVIAAASFVNEIEGAKFIGKWMLELSYLNADNETMLSLNSWLERLCIAKPILFAYCGKAVATLNSFEEY